MDFIFSKVLDMTKGDIFCYSNDTHQYHKYCFLGSRADSVIKNTECSDKGLQFCSQFPHYTTHNCLQLQLQRTMYPLLDSLCDAHIHTSSMHVKFTCIYIV